MSLKISELADRAEVNLQTIRFYEREGLLPRPPRLPSGYRSFPDDALRRVRFIKRAQEIGFSLAEIQELLSIRVDARSDCSKVQRMARGKIAGIEGKISTLRAMKR